MKFLEYCKSILIKYPIAVAVTIFIIIFAIVMSSTGKQFQIGGILEKIWGKKKINVREIPPDNRVDKNGNLIQPGVPDENGYIHVPIDLKIKEPSIFSNPEVIIVEHPIEGKKEIQLPTGIKNKDVKEIIEIKPNIYEIRNNDKGVNTKILLEIINEK